MRKILAVWFCLLFLLVPAMVLGVDGKNSVEGKEAEAKPTLRFIADCNFPPFAFKAESGYTGFDIELGEAIGNLTGSEVEWIPASFDLKKYATALKDKKADAILSALTITASRKKDFDFTVPYFRTSLGIAALNRQKGAVLLQLRKRKFEGSKVGVMQGTTGEKWARSNLKATLIAYDSAVDMARALWEGDLRAILIDEELLHYIVSRYPYDFAVISRDLNHEVYGIAVEKGNSKLLQELNDALEKINEQGVYSGIYNRWFGPKRTLPPVE